MALSGNMLSSFLQTTTTGTRNVRRRCDMPAYKEQFYRFKKFFLQYSRYYYSKK